MQETDSVASPTADPPQGLAQGAETQAAETPSAPSEPGPASVEGEEPGAGEETPPAWHSAANLDELVEHGEVKPRIEEREEASFKRGQSETHSRMQPFLQRQDGNVRQIAKDVRQFTQSLGRMSKDGTLNQDALGELLTEHADTFAAMSGVSLEQGTWKGARGLLYELAQVSGDKDAIQKFDSRLEMISQGDLDTSLYSDLVETLTKAKVTEAIAKETPKIEARVRSALEAEGRARERQDGNPPAKTAGRGGGGGQGQPRNETEARNLHATGQWTTPQLKAFLASQ